MSTAELRQRLIDKIAKTDDENLLQFRLLELESENFETYTPSDDQRAAVSER